MDSKGYYKTLGVSENATQDEIKKSFRRLSVKYHPDKQANKSDKEKKEAEAKFKEINEAYQILSDDEKRRQYDSGGSFDFGKTGDGFGGFDFGNFGNFDFDEFGVNGDGFDFSNLFGGYRNNRNAYKQNQRQPEKGSDINMSVPMSIEELFSGCTKKVKYYRNVRCPNCHGVGGTNKHTCPDCHGTGVKVNTSRSPFGFTQTTTTCSKCSGKGYVVDTKCPTCNGTGFKREETILEIKFDPGMIHDFSKQYLGKGNESQDQRGQTGDFYAKCKHVYDTERYQILNNDVYEKIEIPYYDALLGCEYILEKPDHKKIKIIIPSCVQNGKQLKLTGEGIPFINSNRKGDYYLIIVYKIPDKLSWKERNALEALKLDLNSDNNIK